MKWFDIFFIKKKDFADIQTKLKLIKEYQERIYEYLQGKQNQEVTELLQRVQTLEQENKQLKEKKKQEEEQISNFLKRYE